MEGHKERKADFDDAPPSRIAELNDALRRTGRGGRVVLTNGVMAQGPRFAVLALTAVRSFSGFNANNDPYREHDCAITEVEGTSVLWKIDYYDTAMSGHSPNPADPEVTCRVLTIMLADEY